MNKWESEKIKKDEHKGCPVCQSKKTGKWITSGMMGSSDHLYYCLDCGTVRVNL